MKCTFKSKTFDIRFFPSIFLTLIFLLSGCAGIHNTHPITEDGTKQQNILETMVVSSPADAYFSLAQKISSEEDLKLVAGLSETLPDRPKHIILVAAPANLTAERLTEIGHFYQEHEYYPALGIISGSTIDAAQQLWERRDSVITGNHYTGGDVEILQLIYEPSITQFDDSSSANIELNKSNLITSLKQADYFYWTRHTGPKDWSWNEEYGNWTEEDQIRANDIPPLKPSIIYSLTCSSFRPWLENSMAIAFVDQGAAAFLGFLNTPHSVVTMKQSTSVPGITTWSEFPLGLAAQVQNRAATGHVFKTPQLFLLGDPRIHMSQEQPYQILSDTIDEKGKRVIKGESEVKGILSVQIKDGAEYDSLSVRGLSSIRSGDVFYNSKLQALDLNGDTYILFPHVGGNFEIDLSKNPAHFLYLADALLDAFDFSWVVFWLNTYVDWNPHIYTISIPVLVSILIFKLLKQKKHLRDYRYIFLSAFLIVLIRWIYFLLRFNDYTVSSSLISHTPFEWLLGYLGVFSCISGGLILMRDSKRRAIKSLGLLFAVSRQFWLTGFYLIFITLLNIVSPITRNTEPWLLRYELLWLSLLVLTIEVCLILALHQRLKTQQISMS